MQIGDTSYSDIAWVYDFPTRQLLPIAGLVAFYDEKVDTFLDGRLLDRPVTLPSPLREDRPDTVIAVAGGGQFNAPGFDVAAHIANDRGVDERGDDGVCEFLIPTENGGRP